MQKQNEALIDACVNNNLDNARRAIGDLAEINTTKNFDNLNPSASTPIIIAVAKRNNHEFLSFLLENGADITIRCQGFWLDNDGNHRVNTGNALDIAIFFSDVDRLKILLLHAVINLDSKAQASLLERMPQKNVLLYIAMTYPKFMSEIVKEILEKKDINLTKKIMCELASSDRATPNCVDQYLKLLVDETTLSPRMSTLEQVQFDNYLNWFATLPRDKHANKLIKDLNDAKVNFLLDGNENLFNQSVIEAIQIALPTVGKQACWKVAIGYFLEAFAVILPISRTQIEFYKKADAARQLEELQSKLSGVSTAPMAFPVDDVVVVLNKN